MKLSDWIKQAGISQAEFARLAGLSEGTVSLLVAGKTWPKKDTAERVSRATNGAVTVLELTAVEAAE